MLTAPKSLLEISFRALEDFHVCCRSVDYHAGCTLFRGPDMGCAGFYHYFNVDIHSCPMVRWCPLSESEIMEVQY